jgi:hypothetical protein
VAVKRYERRETGAYPYFKLATWDGRVMAWRAGRATTPTREAAEAMAHTPGRYRVEQFDECGGSIGDPFEVR